ncbi:hypothetical protein Tco_1191057 [Tanacetum coccineum]
MAALRYWDEHNKVGYLQKPKGSDDYHQILDFLGASHIRYALTNDPIIFDSLVKQFWSTATLRSPELGPPAILATIDETPYTITEESIRSQLQLADDGGIDDLPIVEIYSGMDNLGYVTEGKLTFFKNKFSPQWRFLVHTILHCLSTKSGSWDQFGSSIAVALICLSDGRRFNWSSYIFKGMVSNIGNAKKFLMYPRFLQTILGIETSITRQYHVFKLSSKLFANMKLNFAGQPMPLLAAMLSQAQEGEGAGADVQAVPPPIPETIPETRHESDHSQDHLSHTPKTTSYSLYYDSLGGSFYASPPRSTPASPAGPTSGGAEDPMTLTALSVWRERYWGGGHTSPKHEVKLKPKKRKVVVSDSDNEDVGEQDVDLDALNALANAAVTVDSTKSPGGPSKNPAACSYDPTMVMFHLVFAISGSIKTVSPGSTTVPTSSFVPAAETIPARSGTTTATPSSPVRDARKGKGVAVEEPTVTQDKTFKQLEEERLGWEAAQRLQAQELADLEKQRAESLMQDANLARQMSQDFEMTEDQRKRQQEVLASAANYSDAAWDIILARLQANPDLSSTIFGVNFTDDDFAARMVALNQGLLYTLWLDYGLVRKKLSPELAFKKSTTNCASSLKKEGDPDAEHKLCIKYASDEDFVSDCDTPVYLYAVVDWELLPTGLGSINAIYRLDNSRKYFISLREILHLIRSWRLYTLSNVHVLETVSGEVLYMFADVSYPLSVKLMERMLKHKLEIDKDVVGNDMTTAEQLIRFIKNQIAAAQVSPV